MTQHPIDGQGPICPQTEGDNRPAGLGVTYSQHLESLSVVGFLNQDYRYKSVTTQIPHDTDLIN
jgi:hypothetical protein